MVPFEEEPSLPTTRGFQTTFQGTAELTESDFALVALELAIQVPSCRNWADTVEAARAYYRFLRHPEVAA